MPIWAPPFMKEWRPRHCLPGLPRPENGLTSPIVTSAALDALVADLLPLVGVVLGSGLGAFGEQLAQCVPYTQLSGMPVSAVPGHAGNLRLGRIDGIGVACLQGRVHLYEGHEPSAVVFGVRLLARLGCR